MMFGDMFDDDASDSTNPKGSNSATTTNSPKTEGPPAPRQQTGFCGISNHGATCYLNSLLQTLVMTPEFRVGLLSLGSDQLGTLGAPRARKIPLQLQQLFARLLLSDQASVSARDLTDSFGWTDEDYVQQDVQELNRVLFSALEESLVGTSGETMIRELYHGTIQHKVECTQCNNPSITQEDFLDLCISVSGSSGLCDALSSLYTCCEMLCGQNQYRCDKCKCLVDAKKSSVLQTLPAILTVSLLRFTFDLQTLDRKKETGRFAFPLELDMSPYVTQSSQVGQGDQNDLIYDLYSVLIHKGGSHGGHYHAYIRDLTSLGRWDMTLTPASSTTPAPPPDLLNLSRPEQVLATILSRLPDKSCSLDKLGGELLKQTGVSWNKRYKNSHGPISKFLKRFSDIFMFHEATGIVEVKPGIDILNMDRPPPTEEVNGETHRSKASPDESWFDFNDARTFPINVKDIEGQFQGKESAYMLFYRRRNLPLSEEAIGNPLFSVPSHLADAVIQENQNLQEKRNACELQLNSVEVSLHFSQLYTYGQGALQPLSENCQSLPITVDKRDLPQKLYNHVRQTFDDFCNYCFVIYTCKELPAGLHIYDHIPEKSEEALSSFNLTSGLFVWDGFQAGGEINPPIGAENEPVYITLLHAPNRSPQGWGFPKSSTLGDLRRIFEDLLRIDLANVQLYKKNQQADEGETQYTMLEASDEDKIGSLRLEDGDQIATQNCVGDGNLGNSLKEPQSVTITVEVRSGNSVENVMLHPKMDNTIQELKVMAMSMTGSFMFTDGGQMRLLDNNLGVLPPLVEERTLSEVGVKKGSTLVLQNGRSPTIYDVVLTCSLGPTGQGQSAEVMLEKSTTVEVCLQCMKEKLKATGSEYYLCKTTALHEPASPLKDLTSTLSKENLKSGDHLLVCPGRLAPPGFIKLYVQVLPAPPLPCTEAGGQGDGAEGVVEWITKGIKGLLSKTSDMLPASTYPPVSLPALVTLGDVIIKRTETLSELKQQMLTLLEPDSVPGPNYLRVRLMGKDGRAGAVLKGPNDTLSQLHVMDENIIGLQFLQFEENLSCSEMLLTAGRRDDINNCYTNIVELVFSTSGHSSFPGQVKLSLHQQLADCYALPVEQIHVARHNPDKKTWIIITPEQGMPHHGSTQGKGRGKQKKGKGRQVGGGPPGLKEGDFLGVLFCSDPSVQVTHETFKTSHDQLPKPQPSQDTSAANNDEKSPKKSKSSEKTKEVGVKIHVDNFR